MNTFGITVVVAMAFLAKVRKIITIIMYYIFHMILTFSARTYYPSYRTVSRILQYLIL